MKYYLDSALKESDITQLMKKYRLLEKTLSRLSFEGKCQYLTKEKVWILYYKESEETLSNIKI